MPYVSQEKKAQIVAAAKPILKKYGLKATFSVGNGSTLYLNISQGPIDFIANYNKTMTSKPYGLPSYWSPAKDNKSISESWYQEQFSGVALDFLNEIWPVLMDGNWDKSDIQSDYFDVGWYCYINVGKWNKPYICTAQEENAAQAA
jgi:hypothetical protein